MESKYKDLSREDLELQIKDRDMQIERFIVREAENAIKVDEEKKHISQDYDNFKNMREEKIDFLTNQIKELKADKERLLALTEKISLQLIDKAF